MHLDFEKWIFVYEKSNFNFAQKVFDDMAKACKQLGLRVEEPHWVELVNERSREDLEAELHYYMFRDKNEVAHPRAVVCLLKN